MQSVVRNLVMQPDSIWIVCSAIKTSYTHFVYCKSCFENGENGKCLYSMQLYTEIHQLGKR